MLRAPRITSAKLIAVGLATATVAAAVGIAIGQAGHRHDLTRVPAFWVAAACFVAGVLLTVVGVVKRDSDAGPHLTQTARDHSEQYQAGRDINITDKSPKDP